MRIYPPEEAGNAFQTHNWQRVNLYYAKLLVKSEQHSSVRILSVYVVVDNRRSSLFCIMCVLCEGGVWPWGMRRLTDTQRCSSQRSWRARPDSAPHGCNVWPRCASRNAYTGVVASLLMVHRERWTSYQNDLGLICFDSVLYNLWMLPPLMLQPYGRAGHKCAHLFLYYTPRMCGTVAWCLVL